MRKVIAASVAGLVAAFGATLVPLSAQAAVAPVWEACATTDVSTANRPNSDDCTASQVIKSTDGNSVIFAGTDEANIEALNLDVTIEDGATISFEYLGNCAGGAPRVYVTIGGTIHHTGEAAQPCGVEVTGSEYKKVTLDIPNGGPIGGAAIGGWDVAAAGVVVDAPTGPVSIRNVKLGAHNVDFKATTGQPDATTSPTTSPSATTSPTTSPSATGSPTTTATATATATTTATATASPTQTESQTTEPTPSETTIPAGGGSLPVTGESNKGPLIATVAVGMLLVSIGGILYGVARRRRAVESY